MDNFERVLHAVRRRLDSRSSSFQTSSEHGQFLIRTHLASRLNVFSFSFEHVWLLVETHLASRSNVFGCTLKCISFERIWLLVRMRFIQRSNASRLWSKQVHTLSERVWTKNALYLFLDEYYIWRSSIHTLDNFELFINHQHYFSSFKLLHHSSHFAKSLFNRQRDYCTCAIKPSLCSDN